MKKQWFGLAFVFCSFLFGVYIWRVKNTGTAIFGTSDHPSELPVDEDILAEVADGYVYLDDLEFENRFISKDLQSDESKVDTEVLSEKEKFAIKSKTFDSIIERKILYSFLLQDKSFAADNKDYHAACVKTWELLKSNAVVQTDDDSQRLKVKICEQSLIEQYVKERVMKESSVKDEDMQRYYKEHEDKFKRPPQIKIRQIVLATEKDAQWVRARLNRSNFSQMAQTYSISPDGKKGGALGPYAKGDMPQVFDAAFMLHESQISEIFKSTYGFHLFIVDEKVGPRKVSFEEAKPSIRADLVKERQSAAFRDWVELAIRSVHVRIIRSFQ